MCKVDMRIKTAEITAVSPAAITLHILQTIRDIASDPSEKIVIFAPTDTQQTIKSLIGK